MARRTDSRPDADAAAQHAAEAWAVFQRKHARCVRHYFERDRHLRAASDEIRRMVEDVLNEGFALSWPAARDDEIVRMVLRGLEREAAREFKRQVRREVSLQEIGDLPDVNGVDPLAAAEGHRRREWFEQRMNELSARDRLVIEGPLDGKSDEDIARELGWVIPTVKKRRHRVMQRLRREARRPPGWPER